MDEVAAAKQAIWNMLSGDATLPGMLTGIFANRAPLGQRRPYVTFDLNSGSDISPLGNGGRRIASSLMFTIKAVTEGNDTVEAEDIMEEVERIITGQALDVAVRGHNYRVSMADRTSPVDYSEDDDTVQINHYGGIYRYFVSATT